METDNKMVAVSRAVWEAFWEELHEQGKKLSLLEFCHTCDKMKDDFAKEHNIPWGFMDNGRYVSYLQKVIKAGGHVNKEDLLSVTWKDIQFDWYEFGVLVKACACVGNIVEDVEKKKREQAKAWWLTLTEGQRISLFDKYVKDPMERYLSTSTLNLSSYKILEIQEKEGATNAL